MDKPLVEVIEKSAIDLGIEIFNRNSFILDLINKLEYKNNKDAKFNFYYNGCYYMNNKLYMGDYNKSKFYEQLKVEIAELSIKYKIDEYVLYGYIDELSDEFKNIKNVNIIELLKIKMITENHYITTIKYANNYCVYNDFISFDTFEIINYLYFLKNAKNYFGLLNE
jgi:hypothetical protein